MGIIRFFVERLDAACSLLGLTKPESHQIKLGLRAGRINRVGLVHVSVSDPYLLLMRQKVK